MYRLATLASGKKIMIGVRHEKISRKTNNGHLHDHLQDVLRVLIGLRKLEPTLFVDKQKARRDYREDVGGVKFLTDPSGSGVVFWDLIIVQVVVD